MNTEELKMVLETINNLAGGATDAAIWWIILHYGGQLLVHLSWVFMVGFIVLRLTQAISGTSEWSRAGRTVARSWGASNAMFGSMVSSDHDAIARAIAAASKPPNKV